MARSGRFDARGALTINYAQASNVTISGGEGADTITGGSGNGIIGGFTGDDTLYGGTGAGAAVAIATLNVRTLSHTDILVMPGGG